MGAINVTIDWTAAHGNTCTPLKEVASALLPGHGWEGMQTRGCQHSGMFLRSQKSRFFIWNLFSKYQQLLQICLKNCIVPSTFVDQAQTILKYLLHYNSIQGFIAIGTYWNLVSHLRSPWLMCYVLYRLLFIIGKSPPFFPLLYYAVSCFPEALLSQRNEGNEVLL